MILLKLKTYLAQQQDPMAGGMNFPGMEGMSQKEMKKACKKMMKQWTQMMNMMATGTDFKGSCRP